jgi:hypothetical protein
MPRADQRLRSASSPISAAARRRQRRNTLSGEKLSGMSPDSFVSYVPDRSRR